MLRYKRVLEAAQTDHFFGPDNIEIISEEVKHSAAFVVWIEHQRTQLPTMPI